MTTNAKVLRGPHVLLRPPQPEDVESRLALGNDPGIMCMFGTAPASLPPLTGAGATRWVEGLARRPHAWVVEHAEWLLGETRRDGVDPHDARTQLAVGFYSSAGNSGMDAGKE